MGILRLCLVVALAGGLQQVVSAVDPLGSLLVESEPAGASVYVDGRLAGETPLTVSAVAAGVHRVRVVRLGYLENSRLVTVKPGAQATLRARLTDPAPQTAQAAALKIVVLEGEGAVNIIQQKTAVAPVIEVRDRNDQPVSGAVVKFAIQKGRASFNGVRTLTATTDALGRATATGLTPIGGGPLQIAASAAFQGQTAALTIAQTNVLTAAQASAAAAGGTATAGSGGLSHTALASIIGGAGAGAAGVLIASKNTSGSESSNPTSGGPPSTITSRTLSGPLASQIVVTTVSAGVTCVSTRSISGTMTTQLDQRADGTITGSGSTNGTQTETAVTGSSLCTPGVASIPFNWGGPITGTAANMTIPEQQTSFTSTSPATVTVTNIFAFTGTLSNGVITGTVTYSTSSSGQQNPPFNGTISSSGSTTFPVTLR